MDVDEALAESAEAGASLREAGWTREADVMDTLAAEVERLRELVLRTVDDAEGMLAMPADEWAAGIRAAAKAAGGE